MQGAGLFSGKPIPLALMQRFWVGGVFLGLSYRLLSGNKVSPLTCGYADRAGQERCSDNLSSCDGNYGPYIGSYGVPYIGSCQEGESWTWLLN